MNNPNLWPPQSSQSPQPTVERPTFFIRLMPPLVTRILLGINVAVFIAMTAYGYFAYDTLFGSQTNQVLFDFGAKFNSAIIEGQTWRLFTAMFLHIGAIHLLVNLYALNALGPLVEGYFGHQRFTAIYILGGLFGSLASFAFSPNPSAGASGAIFGLAGATTVYFLRYRENFGARGRAILQNMLLIIGINLVFGLSMPGIDNWGHVGGLLGGAVVAYGLLPKYQRPTILTTGPHALQIEQNTVPLVTWVILCIAVLALGVQFATRWWAGV